MDRKETRIQCRLTQQELDKLHLIAATRDVTLSEAMRLIVRNTQIRTSTIIDAPAHPDEEMILA